MTPKEARAYLATLRLKGEPLDFVLTPKRMIMLKDMTDREAVDIALQFQVLLKDGPAHDIEALKT